MGKIPKWVTGEFFGTFLLVFFGCGSVSAALRLPIPYVDPKASDNSPAEEATYDERSRQIAREMFYLMSTVKGGTGARASG